MPFQKLELGYFLYAVVQPAQPLLSGGSMKTGYFVSGWSRRPVRPRPRFRAAVPVPSPSSATGSCAERAPGSMPVRPDSFRTSAGPATDVRWGVPGLSSGSRPLESQAKGVGMVPTSVPVLSRT